MKTNSKKMNIESIRRTGLNLQGLNQCSNCGEVAFIGKFSRESDVGGMLQKKTPLFRVTCVTCGKSTGYKKSDKHAVESWNAENQNNTADVKFLTSYWGTKCYTKSIAPKTKASRK